MSFKAEHLPFAVSIGTELKFLSSFQQMYQLNIPTYDFVMVPLVHPCQYRTATLDASREYPLTYSDTVLRTHEWEKVIAKISPAAADCDSPYKSIRETSTYVLAQELELAQHYGVMAILLPAIKKSCQQIAHVISQYLVKHMPFLVPAQLTEDSWEAYQLLKASCEHTQSLAVCLDLDKAVSQTETELEKWKGEFVALIRIKTELFKPNKSGYPVLPKYPLWHHTSRQHQRMLAQLLPYCSRLLLQGKNPYDCLDKHKDYLVHFYQQLPAYPRIEHTLYQYNDRLQSPLQPLMTNLGSASYELFETDQAKYQQYENALTRALSDYKKYRQFFQAAPPTNVLEVMEELKEPVRVLVVGAGRGPLVKAAFKAGQNVDVKVRVVAMEKNKNALPALQNLVWTEPCGKALEIVVSDIREWKTEERFEIILSELLGSFGDNELCPECLDGAQRLLKPGGVYVPYKYCSYLHPVSAEKIWAQAKSEGTCELPHVIKLHSASYIGTPQPVFEFAHPKPEESAKNSRYTRLNFASHSSVVLVHGLAGYFDGILYQDVHTSNLPVVAGEGRKMHTWFPMFFPLIEPVLLEKGECLTVHMWRCLSPTHAWYEWTIATKQSATIIHNHKGKAYAMGLHQYFLSSSPFNAR